MLVAPEGYRVARTALKGGSRLHGLDSHGGALRWRSDRNYSAAWPEEINLSLYYVATPRHIQFLPALAAPRHEASVDGRFRPTRPSRVDRESRAYIRQGGREGGDYTRR